ncbi:MAG: hypothetical protein R2749_24180 [Acidimicrobiales bacterium]
MILYVLKRYPRLSETFIIRELLNLEAAGLTIGVDALLEPEEQPRHPELDAVRAEVRYLPRRPRRQPEVLAAHGRVARRHPAGWARAVVGAARRHRQGDARPGGAWAMPCSWPIASTASRSPTCTPTSPPARPRWPAMPPPSPGARSA